MKGLIIKDLRGGLIGCGFFSINHLHAWREVKGASIVTLCDRNQVRLGVAGDQFGIAARYSDAEEMLAKENLDFVDIATTVSSHRLLVELAAKYRVPLICQKPMAPSLGDARAMVEVCESAGILFMVHENFRWQSPIQAVRASIDAGEIGRPFWGRVSFRSAFNVFSGQPYLATGERFIIEDLGIHVLDTARFLFGDVARLTARMLRVNAEIRGEDVATILLDHESGLASIIDCSHATRLAFEPFPETLIEVDGTEGSIRLNPGYELIVTDKSGFRRQDASPPLLSWASRPWHNIQESVQVIQQHWVDCLRDGREPATSGHDNVRTFSLVEAAYSAAASGKTVDLCTV